MDGLHAFLIKVHPKATREELLEIALSHARHHQRRSSAISVAETESSWSRSGQYLFCGIGEEGNLYFFLHKSAMFLDVRNRTLTMRFSTKEGYCLNISPNVNNMMNVTFIISLKFMKLPRLV